ncbi:MAG: hypothetical protein ACJ72A_16035 [Nocardioidaceae bacterium]|jgi:hypothetical protein
MPDTVQTVHMVGNVQMDVVAGLVLLTGYFSLPGLRAERRGGHGAER